jgi:alginate O-acetyltransferase complex protein AlgI
VPARAATGSAGRVAVTIASLPFLAFAAMVALAHALLPGTWWRQALMLGANLAFLSTFGASPVVFLPFAAFMLLGYAGLRLIMATRAPALHGMVIAGVVVVFFWLKQYSFLPAGSFLAFSYTTIGLSYIFFRILHMLIDARDGALVAAGREGTGQDAPGIVAFLNYTLNFTSLVSGPIQTFQSYAADQLDEPPPPLGWPDIGRAIERIALGLFKVIVLATILNAVHRESLAALPAAAGTIAPVRLVFVLGISYTFYLYCNFSGYTDIVIGAARLYRLRLPENFDRPFSAPSFIEFWGRWHMTLSNWLKIYVYNPLVLSLMTRFASPRVQELHGIVAYFVTFFLIGLWHGQTSVFAFYGVLLGLGVSVNRLHQVAMAAWLGRRHYGTVARNPWYRMAARGATFTYFTLSLFCFWGSWPQIGMILASLGATGCVLLVLAMLACASVVLGGVELAHATLAGTRFLGSRYTRTVWTTMLATIAVTALILMASPAPDIIYKTF